MPTPCPQPRPLSTTPLLWRDNENHPEGTVVGSGVPYRLSLGYRPGIRHGAHWLTAAANVPSSITRDVPPPRTTIEPPCRSALVIGALPGHSSAAARNVARSRYGSGTRHREVGDAPSSRSTRG